jgi:hypothetical protein
MSTMRFRCYHCHRVHAVEEGAVGRKGRCNCGKMMVVPAGAGDVSLPPERLPLALALPDESGDGQEAPPIAPPAARAAPPRGTAAGFGGAAPLLGLDRGAGLHDDLLDEPETKKGSPLMVKLYFVLAALVGLAWLAHTSPWMYLGFEHEALRRPLPEHLGAVEHTHYFLHERAFWSAILAGLAIALAGEAFLRRRRAA